MTEIPKSVDVGDEAGSATGVDERNGAVMMQKTVAFLDEERGDSISKREPFEDVVLRE